MADDLASRINGMRPTAAVPIDGSKICGHSIFPEVCIEGSIWKGATTHDLSLVVDRVSQHRVSADRVCEQIDKPFPVPQKRMGNLVSC